MAAAIGYVGNTNNLEVRGLQSEIPEEVQNNAVVTVTIKDANGVEVAGETWPQTMTYVAGTEGNYVLGLTRFLAITNGARYTAYIDADASTTSSELFGHWEFPFTARTRTD